MSRFFGKSDIFKYVSTCQTRSYDFWIMNAMFTFVYLFGVYFSFALVISASIHRNVNYFDIQVPMMVTETETLTSTLHHNIFTYLGYFFLFPSNIYIYIYIYRLRLRDMNKMMYTMESLIVKDKQRPAECSNHSDTGQIPPKFV